MEELFNKCQNCGKMHDVKLSNNICFQNLKSDIETLQKAVVNLGRDLANIRKLAYECAS